MADIDVEQNDGFVYVTATVAGQNAFDFDFLAYTGDSVRVTYKPDTADEVPLELGVDYTVSGLSQEAGGAIALIGAYAGVMLEDDQLLIYRSTPIQRLFDYQQAGDFRADVVNRELDTMIMIDQENRRDVDRSIKVPLGSNPIIVYVAPGQVSAFDADGNIIGSGLTTEELAALIGTDAGRALVYPALPADPVYNAGGRRIGNMAAGVDPGDAVTKAQLDANVSDLYTVADRAAIAALPTGGNVKSVFLQEAGRQGIFTWDATNRSALVTADPLQAISVAPAASPTGAAGAWVRAEFEKLNFLWFGAKGDNVVNCSPALNAAITLSSHLLNKKIYVPPNLPGLTYRMLSAISVPAGTHRLNIEGDNPGNTTLYFSGIGPNYVLRLDKALADTAYFHSIENITIRGDTTGTRMFGALVTDASYVKWSNVQFYGLADGLTYRGTSAFSNYHEMVTFYDISGIGVKFLGFQGGGHYTFVHCTFSGQYGMQGDTASGVSGLTLLQCNFEQCVDAEFVWSGDLFGFDANVRCEGCNSTFGLLIAPQPGKYAGGIDIHGSGFGADAGAYIPLHLGGSGGTVAGWKFSGNIATYAGVGTSFVKINGGVFAGEVSANTGMQDMAGAVDVATAGTFVHNNRDSGGALNEYRGAVAW